jgi:succinoglycan biosynthesis protein ExoM
VGHVVIAIPTFRRPAQLERLLTAVSSLATRAQISVLVADNDCVAHQGLDVCERLAADYRWPLKPFIVPERGIAQVRNALVERALADGASFIAMLDDDEWPSANWLDEFLRVQSETGADLLQGSILFKGDVRSPALAACEGVASIRRLSGRIDMLEGAGNLFIARSALDGIAKPYFDSEFALSGGEDLDFFVRLSRAGKAFAWADEAIAYGDIEPERLTLRWILRRAFSIGNSDMRVAMKHRQSSQTMLREGLKTVAALVMAPFLFLALLPFPHRRLEAPRLFFRAAGKAFALFGVRHDTYAHGH